jgi:hypothetical protein
MACMRARTWFALLALLTGLATPIPGATARGKSVHSERTQGAKMKIEAALARQRFASGETIAATVRITNDGTAAVEIPEIHSNQNWQPTYTVTGPAYPQGKTFSFHDAVWGEGVPSDAKADTAPIAPGQTKQEVIPLDQMVRLVEPGTYTLTADLVWAGAEAHSSPVTFTIEPSAIRSCQIVVGPGMARSTMLSAYCLQGPAAGPSATQVAMFRYNEQHDALARMSLNHHSIPSEGAESLVAPWLGYAQGPGKPSPRPVYQAGSRLAILAFEETGGPGITLPFNPQVVRPALASAKGEQDLFVVDNLGKRLALVRFAREGDPGDEDEAEPPAQPTPPPEEPGKKVARKLPPQPPPAKPAAKRPRLLWTMSLPASITNGRAALAAPGASESRHAVLVADDPAGTRLLLADAGDGSKVSGISSVNLPALHVRASSEPCLHVDAKGRARAAVILESAPRPDGSLNISLAEVTWEARRATPHVEIALLAKLPAAPRAAAVTYSVSARGEHRAWVLITADGELMTGAPGLQRLQGTPTLPLDLLLTDRFLVLLTLDQFGAPELERL